MNHVPMTVRNVIMEVFATNTAVSASVVLVSMAQHAKISVKLRHGDPNVSQGSKIFSYIFGCLGRPELFGDPGFQYFCDYDDNNFLPPCRSKLFCLPHPYGCTCGPGWTGPECNRPCPEERYGPGCSLECHCEEQDCNDESGICIQGGCASGWTGENCQIECEEGKWGPECENDCGNCFNGTSCDRISKFVETSDTAPPYPVLTYINRLLYKFYGKIKLAPVTNVFLGTLFHFAVTAVNSINGVSTVTNPVTVGMKSRVIGRLVNVLMVCVRLVLMVTLAVMNVSLGDMVSIVKTSVVAVSMENHVNQPMEHVLVV